MKKQIFSVVVLAGMVLFSCSGKKGMKNVPVSSEADSVSYVVGLNVAQGIKQNLEQNKDLNASLFIEAFLAIMEEDTANLKVNLSLQERQMLVQKFFQKKQEETNSKTLSEGKAFLEEIAQKEGVIKTNSGLMYEVIVKGTGKKASSDSAVVKVHYHGTTPLGEVFDSSVDRGEPVEFPLNRVIRGWTEGVQLMKVGAKYKFYIPAELAYGANPPGGGQGPIKANMPLVFEIELLDAK